MLSFTGNAQIYLYTAPADMRKSFNGLTGLVRSTMNQDVLSGHLFLFLNRRRDRVKLLWWERDGLVIWMKRLEAGTFEMAKSAVDGAPVMELDATQLAMLLGGVELKSAKRRKRYALAG